MATNDARYRLVIFDEVDDPQAVRDLFARVTGAHPTDAMQWVVRLPGTWPKPLDEATTRALLDALYDLGVAAEAWRADQFPDLSPPRTIHEAACLPDGFRVTGLRGEPTHWAPWDKVELISAGRIAAEDEFRGVSPPKWTSGLTMGLQAIALRGSKLPPRRGRAQRVIREPVGEVIVVRRDPRIAFRVVENQMNYAYLGDRLSTSAAENFPVFVADLCARADDAYLTPPTRALLGRGDPSEYQFPSSQALLDYSTHRLLWSWYRRDRDSQSSTQS
jgi:hypothetical protein